MVDNKTSNLNFFVTFNLSDKSRGRSSSSKNSPELRSHFFSKISIVAEKFRIARLGLSLSHQCTFQIPGKLCNRCLTQNNRDFNLGSDQPLFNRVEPIF